MPSFQALLDPRSYWQFIERRILRGLRWRQPNLQGAIAFPPGHFYSPLLDLQSFPPGEPAPRFDGEEMWEHLDLRVAGQRSYYAELLARFPPLPFPSRPAAGHRYFSDNGFFVPSDAFTLSAIIRREQPRRVVEVGSGFSSAVMLDTLQHAGQSADLTFIEPFPDRLNALLSADDRARATVLVQPVQEVPLAVFEQLEERDILFIDSSHVAKIGSDVAFLLLRVLPRLQCGVLIHFHDIFYPYSYPAAWVREGRAWNESLFLRAFLLGHPAFAIVAFNSFAGRAFPEIFRAGFPPFLDNTGGSLWLRKVS